MNINEFTERLFLNLPFEPNSQQKAVMEALSRFCSPLMPSDAIFLLMGYAGTGKTSLMAALVKTLKSARIPVVLMAPTGRAAKVFSKMASAKATTIHRKIYKTDESGAWTGDVGYNPVRNGVFIVDEASMIGDNDIGGGANISLLDDLIEYVYSGEGCKLIFLGDSAQLPPVGFEESPALNVKVLKTYGMRVSRAMLTEVVRQRSKSGILYNATWIRRSLLLEDRPSVRIRFTGFNDVVNLEGQELQDTLETSYNNSGLDNTILITRSNKRAVLYNQFIRNRILEREEDLSKGDRLIVVKNNYLWSASVKGLDFIANGDIGVVETIYETEMKYGKRFANVRLSFPDLDKELDCKIILETLISDGPNMPGSEMTALTEAILNDPDVFPQDQIVNKFRILKTNEYLNALQVKYGYAVTCHKAQGGQWSNVYVDMGYVRNELDSKDFYRWLYTATTRATEKIWFINPCCETV